MQKKPKKSTNKRPTYYAIPMEGTETPDFKVLSVPLGEMQVYGVYNKITDHVEIMVSQLSAAILAMQTSQQVLTRVKVGEINGYQEMPPSIS